MNDEINISSVNWLITVVKYLADAHPTAIRK